MKHYYFILSLLIVGLFSLPRSINAQQVPPEFTSSPTTSVLAGQPFSYPININDVNGQAVSITATTKPDWLSLTEVEVSTFAGTGSTGSVDANGTSASFSNPVEVAVDASGNIYVADLGNNKIRKIAPNGDVTTLAGSGTSGSADANGTSASFGGPFGVAVDASGNVYVADQGNDKIRKIAPNGDVTTLAGSGSEGSVDGNGASASFNTPAGVAVDDAGNVYVADLNNHSIRKIAPNGDVTTLAGTGSAGSVDANGTSASFNNPHALVVDDLGNVYVADRNNSKIRKVAPNGDVTTFAGSGSFGSVDANGTSASFNTPSGITLDNAGNLYVADRNSQKIRKIAPNGDVITLAGAGFIGSDDGAGTSAMFNGPLGVTVDDSGNVYVADTFNQRIRKITGALELVGEAPIWAGSHDIVLEANDGIGGITEQSFTLVVTNTAPIFTSSPVTSVLVGESYSYPITASDADGHLVGFSVTTQPDWLSLNLTDIQVSTFAGSGSSGSVDDNGASASFNGPKGVAIDGLGNVYVADQINHKIRKITPSGDVTTLAGTGSQGAVDDNGILASFRFPSGLALDGSGNLYVADQNNHKIRKITPNGDVTTLAGTGSTGSVDANGTSASFSFPGGVAVDVLGNVYVSDVSNNKIRKIAPNGDVTTLAGTGSAGSTDANGSSASFNGPQKLAVDILGNVYVADRSNHKIRKIAPNGDVTTLAGTGSVGSADGPAASASFTNPLGVATDPSGNVYVTEQSHRIRKISYDGEVTTISGTGSTGSLDGDGSIASFNNPQSIALDGSGNLYVADQANNKIRKITSTIELSGEAPATSGSHDVVVEANDGNGGIVEQAFTVALTNVAPEFTSSPITSVLVGQSYSYPVTTSDADGQSVLLSVTTQPDWLGLSLTDIQVSTFAGSGSEGSADGIGASASFDAPAEIATDASGNIYVADNENHVIRKISPNGDVTTFAGTGVQGSTDGPGISATFRNPSGIAVDASGNVYVADVTNQKIRKIAPDGNVTTFAGTGVQGSADGPGLSASFRNPQGLAIDASGNIYVADVSNHKIRKIAPDGNVTTLAGSGTQSDVDANGILASFNFPKGVAVDDLGNVYVADQFNHKIRKIAPNGDVTTLAGSGSSGSVDANGITASFNRPVGVVLDDSGNIYVSDLINNKIRKVTPNGQVTTTAGTGLTGSDDGAGSSASFSFPNGLALDLYGNLYVSDLVNHKIRKITGKIKLTGIAPTTVGSHDVVIAASDGFETVEQVFTVDVTNAAPEFTSSPVTSIVVGQSYSYPIITSDADIHLLSVTASTRPDWLSLTTDTQVSTFAGTGTRSGVDGPGISASFNDPTGIVLDAMGNVYVGDYNNSKIRKIDPNGNVSTLAGAGSVGSVDGSGTTASFNGPSGIAIDASGNIYVADEKNHKIRKVATDGQVMTFSGSGSMGSADANGTLASFNLPTGIAIDASGNVYVADRSNHKIRKIDNDGNVTTLAGTGSIGSDDGPGAIASFSFPREVAVDASGNVYVADEGNRKIRKIDTDGNVTTLAGSGSVGSDDGPGISASFRFPVGVAVDASGNVYVADGANHKVRKIDATGNVSTLAGSGVQGSADGDPLNASFSNPRGVALDASGNLYISDLTNLKIRKMTNTVELAGTAPASTGSHAVVLVANDGNGGIVEQSFTVLVTPVEITWNGTVWSNGTGPSDTEKAIIAGDYTGGLECAELQVLAFNDMTVPSGATLEVSGNLTVNGDLIIESGGSLISYASALYAGGVTTIKRNTRYVDGKYSFVGTPVEQIASITEATLGSNVYYYDETESYSTNDGLDRWDIMTGELVPGTGYTQANQHTIIFNGEPNTGTITYTGTYTEDTDDANEGWNLVANPYAAAINTAAFLTVNDHISGAVYIWDDNGSDQQRGTNSDYLVANETMATSPKVVPDTDTDRYNNHLGSAQAFFVKFDDNTDTDIVFTESMRREALNDDGNFFRKEELPIARINLTNSSGLFKQAVVGFADDAREDRLNRTYDAQAFNAASDFGLFTVKAGRSLALNGMPQNWEYIQLHLNVKETGSYKISLELEGYNQPIYLKDNLTDEMIYLSDESYSFTSEAGIHLDRFQLLASSFAVLSTEQEDAFAYAFGKTLYIKINGNVTAHYQFYNLSGKYIADFSADGNTQIDLSDLPNGIYILFDGKRSQKVVLK